VIVDNIIKEQIEKRSLRPNEVKAVERAINISFSNDTQNPERRGFFKQFEYMPIERPEHYLSIFINNKAVGGALRDYFHSY